MATYYDLKIACPVCVEAGRHPGLPRQWYHANCGGKMQVGDNAYYKCVKCFHLSHSSNWLYNCETGKHTDYRYASSLKVAAAVSAAAPLVTRAGRKWMINFMQNIGDW